MSNGSGSIGIMFRRELDPARLQDDARRAEALGFDEFWIVEDCFYLGGISQTALALAATSTIKVGIGINPGVAHNPALLAMEYATLARAFPGRLIGGIGHGVSEWMEQIGEDVASPLTAIEEITTSIRRLLRGETISVSGRYVRLRDVQLHAAPTTVPPVVLGVRGPKSIALAGRCADGVLLAENSSPQYVRESRQIMDAERAEPGYLATYAYCHVSDRDPEGALATMRRVTAQTNAQGLSAATANLSYAAALQRLADAGGEQALLDAMPEEWIRDLNITGTVADGRDAVARLHDAGADSVILCPSGSDNWDAWFDSVAALVARS